MSACEPDAPEATAVSAHETATGMDTAAFGAAGRQPTAVYAFAFDGTGSAYFRVWSLNVVLTVLTLGIYGTWAQVRARRYLYAHTHVAGERFEYQGGAFQRLFGRALVIGLVLGGVLIAEVVPGLAGSLAIALIVALPYVVLRSMRLTAETSSWSDHRLSFHGSLGQAGLCYGLLMVLGVLSAGLALPYAWFRQAEFRWHGHRCGQARFRCGATLGAFYLNGAIMLGFSALFVGLFAALGGFELLGSAAPGAAAGMVFPRLLLFIAMTYITLTSLYQGLRFRTHCNDLQIGANRLTNTLTLPQLLSVLITNSLLTLFTLGLFHPWAKIRLTRLLVTSLRLEIHDPTTLRPAL